MTPCQQAHPAHKARRATPAARPDPKARLATTDLLARKVRQAQQAMMAEPDLKAHKAQQARLARPACACPGWGAEVHPPRVPVALF